MGRSGSARGAMAAAIAKGVVRCTLILGSTILPKLVTHAMVAGITMGNPAVLAARCLADFQRFGVTVANHHAMVVAMRPVVAGAIR